MSSILMNFRRILPGVLLARGNRWFCWHWLVDLSYLYAINELAFSWSNE